MGSEVGGKAIVPDRSVHKNLSPWKTAQRSASAIKDIIEPIPGSLKSTGLVGVNKHPSL